MAETAIHERFTDDLEQLRAANSVLLLRDMLKNDNTRTQQAIYEQVCNQEFSHIPEVLEGETRTPFEFTFRDGRLYVMHPRGVIDWLDMHQNGVERARKKPSKSLVWRSMPRLLRLSLMKPGNSYPWLRMMNRRRCL